MDINETKANQKSFILFFILVDLSNNMHIHVVTASKI